MSVARQFRTPEPMPPKLDERSKTMRMQLVISQALLDVVEEWRAQQRPVPNVSEAVRRLIEIGLKVEVKR